MSLRAAINRHCKSCIYDPACPGTWRAQVAACTVTACALWPHRPKPKGSTDDANRRQNEAQSANSDTGGGRS